MIKKEKIHSLSNLVSERLTLDLMTKDDWPHFKYLQTNPQLMTFIRPILPEPQLREMFEQRTAPILWAEQRWFAFIIRDLETSTFVGSIAFKINSTTNACAEVGYLADHGFQGKGYMTESLNCVIRFLFNELNVKKVTAQCATENIASWKVMEKVGMQREGELIANQFLNGVWHNSYCYGLINSSY